MNVSTTTITVSINGLIGVGAIPEDSSYENASFPTADEPNGIMAVWWEDLYLDTAIDQAAIAYELQGTEPNRELVIEWRDLRRVDHGTGNHRRFTFQIRLEEPTNIIRMRYEQTETTGNPPKTLWPRVVPTTVNGRPDIVMTSPMSTPRRLSATASPLVEGDRPFAVVGVPSPSG